MSSRQLAGLAARVGSKTILAHQSQTRRLCVTQLRWQSMRPISISTSRLEAVTMKVPGMGDSISEGTLVEWVKNVGDVVTADEVVCVIETDKVSVDIRASHTGKIVKCHAEIDQEVAVGANLLEIDTDSAAAKAAPSEATNKEPETTHIETSGKASEVAKPPSADKTGQRVPSIKFLGKRSLLKHEEDATSEPKPQLMQLSNHPAPKEDISKSGAIPFDDTPPLWKHLPLTQEEIDYINDGGASAFA